MPNHLSLGEIATNQAHLYKFFIDSNDTFRLNRDGKSKYVVLDGETDFDPGSPRPHVATFRVRAETPGPLSDVLWLDRTGRLEHEIKITGQFVDGPPPEPPDEETNWGWLWVVAMLLLATLVVGGYFTTDRWKPVVAAWVGPVKAEAKEPPVQPEVVPDNPGLPGPTVVTTPPVDPPQPSGPVVVTTPPVDPPQPSGPAVVTPPPVDPPQPLPSTPRTYPYEKLPVLVTGLEEIRLPWPSVVPDGGGSPGSIPPPVALGAREVSQGLWVAIMGQDANPSYFIERLDDKDVDRDDEVAKRPVESMTYPELAEFCNRLSAKARLTPYYSIQGKTVTILDPKGLGYRLPTQREWETAARAGTTTTWSFGDDSNVAAQWGWFSMTETRTHACGRLKANPWGFFDMHGNVAELCQDELAKDLAEPQATRKMVLRGGSFRVNPEEATSAFQAAFDPLTRWRDVGFRVARTLPRPSPTERPH